jgi:hypothetical protein
VDQSTSVILSGLTSIKPKPPDAREEMIAILQTLAEVRVADRSGVRPHTRHQAPLNLLRLPSHSFEGLVDLPDRRLTVGITESCRS